MLRFLVKYEKILKYTLGAFSLFVPLYPKFPLLKIKGEMVAIRLEDFLLLFIFILVFLFLTPYLKEVLKDKVINAIFLFLSIGFLSILSAIFITKTVRPEIAFLHFLRRVEYFVPFFAGFLIIRKDKDFINYFLNLLFLVILFVFIYGVGQKYFHWPVIITQNEEYSKGIALRYVPSSHLTSSFAGHYDLASFIILVIPIVLSLFIMEKDKTKTKRFFFVIFILLLWLLSNTLSRISILSYFLTVFVLLSFLGKKNYLIPIFILSIFIFGLSSNLLDRYINIFKFVKERFRISINLLSPVYAFSEVVGKEEVLPKPFEDRSTSIRLNVEWPRATRAFLKNPLLGTGYSSISLATDNDYLRMLGETGILGFLAFILIFIRIIEPFLFYKKIIMSKASIAELSLFFGFYSSLFGVLTNAFFIDIFEASKFAFYFWFVCGMAYSLGKYYGNEK